MDERSKFCCSICAANLNSKSGLKQHVNVLHKDIKYGCQHCGKQFSSKQYLTDHINDIHKRIKRKCYQCDKDFSSRSYSVHMKSVHGQQRFSCSLCDYQAKTKSRLQDHISFHKGVKYP